MIPHRDDVEALAGVAGLLLEPRDPYDLADRFLAHVMGVFRADAGLFHFPVSATRRTCAVGLSPGEAEALVGRLYGALHRGDEVQGPHSHAAVRSVGRWQHTLAAVVGLETDRRGILALFSTRPSAYHPERDSRLLHHMARHATAAIARAHRYLLNREAAERFALRVDEVERVRNALERHSREVESSLAIRTRYFAQMSHELRTPINAILGYADLLHEGILGELTSGQSDAIWKVAANARQLLTLVNDLLDLSRLEAGRVEIRRGTVDLARLVAEAVATVEVEAKRKGLALHVRHGADLPLLQSDASRIRQVVLNLLSNAVKFTDAGAVSLDVRHIAPEGGVVPDGAAPPCPPGPDGWIGITVEDTGPGIPHGQLEAIFDEYVQLGAGSQGTGLGLAVSRRLARLLGGELVAESEVGVHSTFVLYLPCPAPATAATLDAAAWVSGVRAEGRPIQ